MSMLVGRSCPSTFIYSCLLGIYINSLSLQAVLEKCATSAQEAEENDGPPTAQTPPGLFSSKLVDIYKQNEVYIKELIDAARSLLDLFVNGLRPDIGLKHAPVRTHFRVLSAAMFLLKVSLDTILLPHVRHTDATRHLLLGVKSPRCRGPSTFLTKPSKPSVTRCQTMCTSHYAFPNC